MARVKTTPDGPPSPKFKLNPESLIARVRRIKRLPKKRCTVDYMTMPLESGISYEPCEHAKHHDDGEQSPS